MVYRWFSNTVLNEATRAFATGMPFMSLGALFTQHAGIVKYKTFSQYGTG
jgi:ABC-type amino acid transport system permease subunit